MATQTDPGVAMGAPFIDDAVVGVPPSDTLLQQALACWLLQQWHIPRLRLGPRLNGCPGRLAWHQGRGALISSQSLG